MTLRHTKTINRILAGGYAACLFLGFSLPATADAACCNCHTGDPSATTCFWTDKTCDDLVKPDVFPNLAGIQCLGSVEDSKCRTKEEGGICPAVYQASTFNTSSATNTTITHVAATPKLGVDIPGLKLATGLTPVDGYIQIPFIGQYISGFYRWAVGMALVATALMIIYGGFLYILGSTATSIQSGEEKIKDALVGLLIFMSCVTILNAVNPDAAKLGALKIKVAEPENALANWLQERKKVVESATVKPKAQDQEVAVQETPVAPAATSTTGTVPQPTPQPQQPPAGGTPTPQPTPQPQQPKPGAVVKDQYGNYVAQGECPSDMKAIRYSADYEAAKKVNVPSFCMDVFEAPNKAGVKPIEGVTEPEADWYCYAQGKRLCTSAEFTRACLGPKGDQIHMYGDKFIPGTYTITGNKSQPVKKTDNPPAPCNYDSAEGSFVTEAFQKTQFSVSGYPKSWEEDLLNPDNIYTQGKPDAVKAKARLDKWETMMAVFEKHNINRNPSGGRPKCVSQEGVYDLLANVQEITLSKYGAKLTIEQRMAAIPTYNATCPQIGDCTGTDIKPYAWRGFFWNPVAHLANINAIPSCETGWGSGHAIAWRGFENGFRCCLPLQE